MIKRLYISNFKSLVDFELNFSKFTCLIGLNGAGKSTVLQALDFLCQLMQGKVGSWLESRGWSSKDLTCKLTKKVLISYKVEIELQSTGQIITWEGEFNSTQAQLRCTSERIYINDPEMTYLKVSKDGYGIWNDNNQKYETEGTISFNYEGSVLSQLKEELLNNVLKEMKSFFTDTKSMELLSPHLLRQRSRPSDDIGMGGEKLSAFMDSQDFRYRKKMVMRSALKKFYPYMKDYHVKTLRAGWKELYISEVYPSESHYPLMTEAHHINDGLLRILTILALTESRRRFLLFDEIENGINPEILEKLVDLLTNAPQQIVVTTHSPMILNYLSEEVAKKSVILVYKTKHGYTKTSPFFNLPVPAKKLTMMSPGEVFLDTYLEDITNDIMSQEVGIQ